MIYSCDVYIPCFFMIYILIMFYRYTFYCYKVCKNGLLRHLIFHNCEGITIDVRILK